MTPTDTLLASLDPDPVLRGRQFERFVVTLLRTHPLWALQGWFAHAMAVPQERTGGGPVLQAP
jgi:hypothetical protein